MFAFLPCGWVIPWWCVESFSQLVVNNFCGPVRTFPQFYPGERSHFPGKRHLLSLPAARVAVPRCNLEPLQTQTSANQCLVAADQGSCPAFARISPGRRRLLRPTTGGSRIKTLIRRSFSLRVGFGPKTGTVNPWILLFVDQLPTGIGGSRR